MPALRGKRDAARRKRGATAAAAHPAKYGPGKSKAGASRGRQSGGGADPEPKRGAIARLKSLGGVADMAILASDDSGIVRLRLIVSVVTYVANLLLDLIAILAKKKVAKAQGAPVGIADAAEKLAKGGVGDGLISRTEVYDCKTGHTFEVWEVGRWGTDPSRMEVLGQGPSLGAAMDQWLRGTRVSAVPRKRFTGAR